LLVHLVAVVAEVALAVSMTPQKVVHQLL